MAKQSTGPGRSARMNNESDVYTVLACVAFLFLVAATIYVGFRAQTMLGGLLPPGGV